jgi:hypothetical protein
MKKIIILLLLTAASQTFAQSFEGTIKWVIKTEITDPKKKAQMEEAKKKMNDPSTQADMKKLEAQMNDPQMKAMMENNPQMKAQMEKAIAAMKSGNFDTMLPTGMVIKIKGNDVVTKMEGGVMTVESLYIKSKDQAYTLDRENKTYSVVAKSDNAQNQANETTTKVTKTSETAKIMNYNCTKYIVEIQSKNQTMTQNIWATTEIKDIDLKGMARQKGGNGQKLFYEEIEGVPLKTEMKTSDVIVTSEVTSIKKESQNAGDFVVPADFKEVPPMFK